MWKTTSVLAALLVGVPLVVIVMSSFFAQREERARRERLESWESLKPPQAALGKKEHQLGRVDPHSLSEVRFQITNAGEQRLTLDAQPSRDGVRVEVLKEKVKGGESTGVRLVWVNGEAPGPFQHEARLRTNDPETPELVLTVSGEVQAELILDPPLLELGKLPPHEPSQVETVLYSSAWEQLDVQRIQCTPSALKWRLEPLSAEELKKRYARWGQRLIVTLPPGLASGPLAAEVCVDAAPRSEPSRPRRRRLELKGQVLRRLAFYGDIEFTGNIDLGKTQERESRQTRLRMRVRDEQLVLPLRSILVEPDFLKVSMAPAGGDGALLGEYYLDVEVPSSAPVCNYLQDRLGRIKLEFDHPRIRSQELGVSFAVTPATP